MGGVAPLDFGQDGHAMGGEAVDPYQRRVADGLGIVCKNMAHGISPCYGGGPDQPMPGISGRQSVELPLSTQVNSRMNRTRRISLVTAAVLALLLIIQIGRASCR